MGNFYTDVIQKDPRYTSSEICSDPALLHPVMLQKIQGIIADMAAEGVSLMIFETFRSEARQLHLFNQGVTQLKNVGVHAYGLACDLTLKDRAGNPSWDSDFKFYQALALKYKLIWGGDWGNPTIKHSFIDSDHLQWCSIAHQESLFDGTWYPSDQYDPT